MKLGRSGKRLRIRSINIPLIREPKQELNQLKNGCGNAREQLGEWVVSVSALVQLAGVRGPDVKPGHRAGRLSCCELNRCKPVKARVRSVGVIVDPPRLRTISLSSL